MLGTWAAARFAWLLASDWTSSSMASLVAPASVCAKAHVNYGPFCAKPHVKSERSPMLIMGQTPMLITGRTPVSITDITPISIKSS